MNVDPFINYPDEIIIKICNELDTPSLLKAAEASSKIYQVCSDIIKEKRTKYVIEKEFQKEVDTVIDDINNHKIIFYMKKFTLYNISSEVSLIGELLNFGPNDYRLYINVEHLIKFDSNNENPSEIKGKVSKLVSFIIPVKTDESGIFNLPFSDQKHGFRRNYVFEGNRDNIEQLIRSLHQQGYEFKNSFFL